MASIDRRTSIRPGEYTFDAIGCPMLNRTKLDADVQASFVDVSVDAFRPAVGRRSMHCYLLEYRVDVPKKIG